MYTCTLFGENMGMHNFYKGIQNITMKCLPKRLITIFNPKTGVI